MFDWFWEFLYGISKSIFRLIDGLMGCANMLCGITPITVYSEQMSFIDFLLTHRNVMLAFETATIIGVILIGAFAIYGILRNTINEKGGATPGQIFVKSFKTIFMFLCVPACMILFARFSNLFIETLYTATLGGSSTGIGSFLCGAFSQDALNPGTNPLFYTFEGFDYTDTDALWNYIDISDFDFFFSWIAGVCILISLAQSLLMFVDRAISIVVLFIVSPISMSTTMIDDGAHFKLWRDQVLVKFLTGYGCILGMNIYILVIAAITDDAIVFFDSSFFNNLMKIAFILGGAVSMQRVMALIGNLVSAGAGSNELRDNAIANAGFKSALGTAGRVFSSPFRAARGLVNSAKDMKQYGVGSTVAGMMGFKTDRDYGGRSKVQRENFKDEMAMKQEAKKKNHQEFANMIGSAVANAIGGGGGGDNKGGGGGGNANNQPAQRKENPMVNNAIMMSLGKNPGQNDKK